jgi:hypothetical protein
MRACRSVALLGIYCLLATGCLARQVAADGKNFRQALLDMYTEQLMDNLIKARNNQPFLQVDYKGLLVTDTQTVKANISDESDPSTSRSIARKTGAIFTAMHGYTNKLFFGGSFDLKRDMQIGADPVTGKTDIYDYYMAFANDPDLFYVTAEKPRCPHHIAKKCGRNWYWVPVEASGVFLQLALRTTVMRGPDTPPPILWSTTLTKLSPRYDENGISLADTENKYVATFTTALDNDKGFATVSLANGKKEKLALFKLDTMPYVAIKKNQPEIPNTSKTSSVLYVVFDQKAAKTTVESFANRPAQIYLPDHPDLTVPLSVDAQRLQNALVNYRRSMQ